MNIAQKLLKAGIVNLLVLFFSIQNCCAFSGPAVQSAAAKKAASCHSEEKAAGHCVTSCCKEIQAVKAESLTVSQIAIRATQVFDQAISLVPPAASGPEAVSFASPPDPDRFPSFSLLVFPAHAPPL